jgi:hypothetical protein
MYLVHKFLCPKHFKLKVIFKFRISFRQSLNNILYSSQQKSGQFAYNKSSIKLWRQGKLVEPVVSNSTAFDKLRLTKLVGNVEQKVINF